MKTSLHAILIGFSILCTVATTVQAQSTWDLGVSYRYIRYNEASLGLTNVHGEDLNPHELDLNFLFDIGDPHLRGTLVLGWARYEQADFTYDNLLWTDECSVSPLTYHASATEQHAYRFNPGIEYTINSKGKFTYGCGAGIFYYGTFKGNKVTTDFGVYQHRDSLTGECIEDSSYIKVNTYRAPAKAVQLVGASAHLYAGYEPVTGITFFAQFSVNPMFSTSHHNFALAPSGSVGVYFTFRSLMHNTSAQ